MEEESQHFPWSAVSAEACSLGDSQSQATVDVIMVVLMLVQEFAVLFVATIILSHSHHSHDLN